MEFPYGKAPFWILVVAIITGATMTVCQMLTSAPRPDLVFVVFAPAHYAAYQKLIPQFEKAHNVKVQLQQIHQRPLQTRLQSALLAGTEVPDMVEIMNPFMGAFMKGPLKDVGFVDLTDRIKAEHLDERMVASRFSIWSSRGRIFALPHDVHPAALAYRRDIVEELGIDVKKIETWDDFVKVAHEKIVKDLDGDGIPDRYALDLTISGTSFFPLLLLQRGGRYFDEQGNLTMDSELTIDTMIWYIRQSRGENRISFPAGEGQPFYKALSDGLILFTFVPDWKSKVLELDANNLKGKMALMPLPAWEKGGRRTSTWGGTGLAITEQSKNKELAWELAKYLYLNKEDFSERFALLNIIPPLKEAWNLPAFQVQNEYYSGQKIGRLYAELAPETPPDYVGAYYEMVDGKSREVLVDGGVYYEKYGDKGLREYVTERLKQKAAYVRKVMDRNVFLRPNETADANAAGAVK
ncbi:MAG: extracellular solute-binding protein [Phycisphaerae bacterium]|jgi:arabinosaccharide transport system substrate-binding protein